MSNHDSINEIIRHYGDADESSRLRTGWFQLEQARTQALILRRLPPSPATIVDAGGGAGAYACWLAARGCHVHLLDPVPKHVEQARAASSRQPQHPLASAEVGDARKLPLRDATAVPFCFWVRSIIWSKAKTASLVCAKLTVFCGPAD